MEVLQYDIHRDLNLLDAQELGAVRYYTQRFQQLYRLPENADNPHFLFACHAALPIALTPDLLYQIWIHFQYGGRSFPYETVSDLLLSGLCREVRPQLFQMQPQARDYLLQCLRRHPLLGAGRERELAHFLLAYASTHYQNAYHQKVGQSQRLTAVAHLDPRRAAREIVKALNQSLGNRSEQRRLGSLVDALNIPLEELPELLAYGRALEAQLQGRQSKAARLIADMPLPPGARQSQIAPEQLDIVGATLLVTPELRRLIQEHIDRIKEKAPPPILKKYAKIHLLFHHSLDKQKLLRQLFPGQDFPEGEPLHCFSWQSNLKDLGIAGEINYNIWAWDSSLPVELGRFVLTPEGYYFIILPSEEEFEPLLYRVYSQAGQENVQLLRTSSEDGAETRFWAMMKGQDEPVFVKTQIEFELILAEIIKKELNWKIAYLELPGGELLTKDQDILTLANYAGLLRYDAGHILSRPGFQSTSPSTDLNRMVEIIGLARENEGLLKGESLETARSYPIELELLEKMGLAYETVEGLAYLPAHLPTLRQSFRKVAYTCLRYSFDFFPSDFELRLYQRLIRAGAAFFNVKRPYILGIPIGISTRMLSGKQVIEVYIAHDVVDEPLKGSLAFYAVLAEEISGLLNADEEELYNGDKIELLFALLQARPEAPFAEKLSAYFEDWRNAAQLLTDGKAKKEEYLAACRKALKRTRDLLSHLPSEQIILSPASLAEKVADVIGRIVIAEGFTSYPYQLTWQSRSFDIPAHATPDMLPIEGGTFQMGDVMGDNEYKDEKPVHEVTLGRFALGPYPVTMQEYDAFCEATGREKPGDEGWGRENRPVINVDWYDCVEYCNWLSGIWGLEPVYVVDTSRKDPNNASEYDKKKWLVTPNWQANGYRLPTEAEWEYAARERGKKVRFGNGKDIADLKEINFDASERYKKTYSVVGEYRRKTTPVGSFPPNALRLYDISGNVYDWCWDWFDENYYKQFESRPAKDPTGPDGGSYRVLRGGSWSDYPQSVRAAYRGVDTPGDRYGYVGFRLARTL